MAKDLPKENEWRAHWIDALEGWALLCTHCGKARAWVSTGTERRTEFSICDEHVSQVAMDCLSSNTSFCDFSRSLDSERIWKFWTKLRKQTISQAKVIIKKNPRPNQTGWDNECTALTHAHPQRTPAPSLWVRELGRGIRVLYRSWGFCLAERANEERDLRTTLSWLQLSDALDAIKVHCRGSIIPLQDGSTNTYLFTSSMP